MIGVADGVGGWRQYGVDPGQFSMQLMQACERLVKAGYFVSDQPARLLAQGFSEMQASKKPVIGSSTACLAMLSHADGKLYTANIGTPVCWSSETDRSVVIHAVSLIRNPLIRNSPEDSWKNRKWNPEPFEPKVQNKK